VSTRDYVEAAIRPHWNSDRSARIEKHASGAAGRDITPPVLATALRLFPMLLVFAVSLTNIFPSISIDFSTGLGSSL
jgi:hypothetical protein